MILTVEEQTSECHLSKETNTCISSKWPKNSMQFTLGMPFLGVLGKFYRNRKGLRMIGSSSKVKRNLKSNVFWLQYTLHRNAIFKFYMTKSPLDVYHICSYELYHNTAPCKLLANTNTRRNMFFILYAVKRKCHMSNTI